VIKKIGAGVIEGIETLITKEEFVSFSTLQQKEVSILISKGQILSKIVARALRQGHDHETIHSALADIFGERRSAIVRYIAVAAIYNKLSAGLKDGAARAAAMAYLQRQSGKLSQIQDLMTVGVIKYNDRRLVVVYDDHSVVDVDHLPTKELSAILREVEVSHHIYSVEVCEQRIQEYTARIKEWENRLRAARLKTKKSA
jgi:hypothetical protein